MVEEVMELSITELEVVAVLIIPTNCPVPPNVIEEEVSTAMELIVSIEKAFVLIRCPEDETVILLLLTNVPVPFHDVAPEVSTKFPKLVKVPVPVPEKEIAILENVA